MQIESRKRTTYSVTETEIYASRVVVGVGDSLGEAAE